MERYWKYSTLMEVIMAKITIETEDEVRVYDTNSFIFVAVAQEYTEYGDFETVPVVDFDTTDGDFEDLINFAEETYYGTEGKE